MKNITGPVNGSEAKDALGAGEEPHKPPKAKAGRKPKAETKKLEEIEEKG